MSLPHGPGLSTHGVHRVELAAGLEPHHVLADQIRAGRGQRPSHLDKPVVHLPSQEYRHQRQAERGQAYQLEEPWLNEDNENARHEEEEDGDAVINYPVNQEPPEQQYIYQIY